MLLRPFPNGGLEPVYHLITTLYMQIDLIAGSHIHQFRFLRRVAVSFLCSRLVPAAHALGINNFFLQIHILHMIRVLGLRGAAIADPSGQPLFESN
jgi:hypothetical protein